jgi:diguanylate cyclase
MSLIDSLRLARMRRSLIAIAAIVVYGLAVWLALQLSLLGPEEHAMLLAVVLLAFAIVLLGAALAVDLDVIEEPRLVDVLLAGWVSVALVLTSFLVVMPWRPLLLVGTFFVLVVAALKLRRQAINRIALLIFVAYIAGLIARLMGEGVNRELELAIALLYFMSLVGGVLVAGEVATLHTALMRRTRELEDVLEKLKTLAMRDDLTGLYNRRQLMEFLMRQKAIADRGLQTFAVCYLDLDHFKTVNDQFGHHRGDELLKTFADIAQRVVREEDFVARIGGEEFVLVLVNASVEEARSVAERLRRQTQLMVVEPDAPDFVVTVSAGITGYHAREAVKDLLSRADSALYAAKRNGRNRVVIATAPEQNLPTAVPGD